MIGDLSWLRWNARRLRLSVPWNRFSWIAAAVVPAGLKPGKIQPAAGQAAYAALVEAVRWIQEGRADALVTAPVCKEAIVKAGIPWVGHTEFLAERFRSSAVMMFVNRRLKISLVTTHLPLRALPAALSRSAVVRALRVTREALVRDFGIRRPRIGLAALNPHAGEGGLFGEEEKRILIPAAREFGGKAAGPLAADTLMREAAAGRYDAVVALYHDQALIPVRLTGWEEAVNVTLGLPCIRTSPVHGTAFDIAGKGRADSRSMSSAIRLAVRLARRRARLQPPVGSRC